MLRSSTKVRFLSRPSTLTVAALSRAISEMLSALLVCLARPARQGSGLGGNGDGDCQGVGDRSPRGSFRRVDWTRTERLFDRRSHCRRQRVVGAMAMAVTVALEPTNASVPGHALFTRRTMTEEPSDVRRRRGARSCDRDFDLAFESGFEIVEAMLERSVIGRCTISKCHRALAETLAVKGCRGGLPSRRVESVPCVFLRNRTATSRRVGDPTLRCGFSVLRLCKSVVGARKSVV